MENETIAVHAGENSGEITRFVSIDNLPEPLLGKVREYGCYGAYETSDGIAVIVEGGDEPIIAKGI